ncbi:MAG: 50S ribosomal protein L1 [Candidatus Aenigmarchaeota archaeon]|nr:50S ribosomal protein L1 [Candidatus Aenigmarchaeota archaeon]
MANEKTLEVVKAARAASKKRAFSQTFDIAINLKLWDTKKPENKLNEIFPLPQGRGNDAKIVIFSDTITSEDAKVYSGTDIERLAANKRELKNMTGDTDFFLAEPKLMIAVGKTLGRILAPHGKMPTVLSGDYKQIASGYKKSVRLKVKDAPVVQTMIGMEGMTDEQVADNIDAVMSFLEKKLAKGKNNIGTVRLKLTMGKPVKLAY